MIDPLDAKEHKDSLEEEGIKLEVNEVEAQDSAQIAYLEQIYNDLEDQDNYYDEDYVPIIEKSPKKLKKEKKEVILISFSISFVNVHMLYLVVLFFNNNEIVLLFISKPNRTKVSSCLH